MYGVLHRDLLRYIWIPNYNLEHLMKTYIKRQLITSVAIFLVIIICSMRLLCNISEFKKWSKIRRVANWNNAYSKTALLIWVAYATLLGVNTRYISVVFIPIIVLVFIGALYVMVTPEGNSKSDEDNHIEANNRASKGDGNGGACDNDNCLLATAVLPCWVLCYMGHFGVDNLVVSQFLLFLTSTLAELALMMARLPSEDVAMAFQIIRRASLVMVLVTAHTMAAEVLGDDVVLACTPLLLTGLLWFSIHFCLSGGGSDAVSVESWQRDAVDMVTSQKTGIVFLSVDMAIMAWVANCTDGSTEVAMDLPFYRFTSALVACSFSFILPSLCVFVLRQWPARNTAPLSSEMEGAIKLISYCRNMMFIAATAYLVLTPLVDVRLRLQAQRILEDLDDILNRFVYS